MRLACSSIMSANILTITWQPSQPPLPLGLPAPHHLITVGDFKLVSNTHEAVSIRFSAASSTKPRQQPAPTQPALPSWRPYCHVGRAPARWSHEGNGAENASAARLASFLTAFASNTNS